MNLKITLGLVFRTTTRYIRGMAVNGHFIENCITPVYIIVTANSKQHLHRHIKLHYTDTAKYNDYQVGT